MKVTMIPKLFFVIPCFNEEESIEHTADQLIAKCKALEDEGKISPESAILFVDDGSTDGTWSLIRELFEKHECIKGISLKKNYGHQTALYAGLIEAKDRCDITISLDADGQHDLAAVDDMLSAYATGNDIVCAVRSNSNAESLPKRLTADIYYRILTRLGAGLIKGHSDYRLASSKAIEMLEEMPKNALFLRGDFLKLPLKYSSVEYTCRKRTAGKSKYSVGKMAKLAMAGFVSNGFFGESTGKSINFEILEWI